MKYAAVATQALPPNNAPEIRPTIGILAPQGMKQVVIIVIFLSLSCSIVRLAITPGTPQPEATSIGMNDLPERPNFLKTLSIMNAIRDIYPQSSSIERRRKRISICGTNPKTEPTPPTIPSAISDVSQSAHPIASRPAVTPGTIHSPKRVSFINPVTQSPIVPIEIV